MTSLTPEQEDIADARVCLYNAIRDVKEALESLRKTAVKPWTIRSIERALSDLQANYDSLYAELER